LELKNYEFVYQRAAFTEEFEKIRMRIIEMNLEGIFVVLNKVIS
jgi:hypothetical protein